jgi:hypothetical protein
MTTLLQRAISEAETLPEEEQDAIAVRLLAEIEDERAWDAQFEATTDAQWERFISETRRDVAAGRSMPLDKVFPQDKTLS